MTFGADPPLDAGPRGFPVTRRSIIAALADGDPAERRRGLEVLVEAYWKPVYLHLRWRWNRAPQDAEDMTQEFFARALESEFFAGYDPAQSRFRTFVRVCLDRFAAKTHRDERRLKRGGGRAPLTLDFAGAEQAFVAAGQVTEHDADQRFHQEWTRALFTAAVAALAAECAGNPKEIRFQVFQCYDLATADGGQRPSYREMAEALGIPETHVTNHLAWARRAFRGHVLDRLRALSGSEEEFHAEARALLGIEAT